MRGAEPEQRSIQRAEGLGFVNIVTNIVTFLTPYRQYFEIVQIIVSVALITSILLQVRGAGLGSVFGGTGTVFKTRRGIDQLLFRMTIVFVVIFVCTSIVGAAIPAPA